MQVDSCARFAQFCIGSRPLACRFEVSFKGLFAILSRNIKVDDDVILGYLDIMQPARIEVRQLRLYVFPVVGWCAVFFCVLCRTVLTNIIQNRVLYLEIDPRLCFFRNRCSKVRFLLELFRLKPL